MSVYCYGGILAEANRIDNTEFIDYSLQRLFCMRKELKSVYEYEEKENVPNAIDSYKRACNVINQIIYKNLQEKAGLKPESISQILRSTKDGDAVTHIECADGMTIVKTLSDVVFNESREDAREHWLISKENCFVDAVEEFDEEFREAWHKFSPEKELVVESIRNAIKPLIGLDREDVDLFNFGRFGAGYTTPWLGVYVDHKLNEIVSDATGTKVTRMVVSYRDQIFGFDIKMRNGFAIITQKDNIDVFSVLKRREAELRRTRTQEQI